MYSHSTWHATTTRGCFGHCEKVDADADACANRKQNNKYMKKLMLMLMLFRNILK